MKTVPEISVIIPIYNVEKFLPQALDSLLSQTFSDFEAVCVNDGSSDNCAEILAAYARKDSRLRISAGTIKAFRPPEMRRLTPRGEITSFFWIPMI